MLTIRLLGQFDVRLGEQPIEIPTRPAQSLLAYLALTAGTAHRREKLAGLLWPDATETNARNNLRLALWRIRKAVEKTARRKYLQTDDLLVAFDAGSEYWLDAAVVAGPPTAEQTPDALIQVASCYDGDLLPGFYDEWVAWERERLRSAFEKTMKQLLDRLLEARRWDDLLAWGERWLALGHAPEPAYRALMLAHGERGDAASVATVYRRCVEALRREFGVEPSEQTQAVFQRLVGSERPRAAKAAAPQARSAGEAPGNLPHALSSFIGREQEIAEVKRLLATSRLLTLTGTGGSGKTRLALQTAREVAGKYGDGVWLVELAPLSDPALTAQAAASTLGVREDPGRPLLSSLSDYLRDRQLLLVLDNCDHLVEACAQLAASLLRACPALRILGTSREALNVAGESVWIVPPMWLPSPQRRAWPDELAQYDAIALFVERAAAARPDFTLNPDNAADIAQVCQRLDGMPLAIELAAARVDALSVSDIAARLNDRFRLLASHSRTTAPRHRTLQAAIDWSYDLLSEQERVLFRRLAVFAGGFTLEAAESVGPEAETPLSSPPRPRREAGHPPAEVLDGLTQLVRKSLVAADTQPAGAARYRMLETIRQYGWDRLREAGAADPARDRHLAYFARLAESAQPHLGFFVPDREAGAKLSRLATEQDNLRAALEWSARDPGRVEAGLHLAGALHWFWYARAQYTEGRAYVGQLLRQAGQASAAGRLRALITTGFLACWQGDFEAGQAALEPALALARQLEDEARISFVLLGLGFSASGQGQLERAGARLQECLTRARSLDDRWLISMALHFLGVGLALQGRFALATSHLNECVALAFDVGGQGAVPFSRFHMGRMARLQADFPQARDHLANALRVFQEWGDRRGVGYALAGYASLAVAQGQPARAARLFGAVAALRERLGSLLEVPLQSEHDRDLAQVRDALEAAAFTAAWEEGQAMPLEEIAAYALAGPADG